MGKRKTNNLRGERRQPGGEDEREVKGKVSLAKKNLKIGGPALKDALESKEKMAFSSDWEKEKKPPQGRGEKMEKKKGKGRGSWHRGTMPKNA